MNSISKKRTSISVKLGTRNLILNRSLPGESLEDTIVRIVNENDIKSKEIDRLSDILEKHNLKVRNILSIHNQKRGRDLIYLNNDIIVEFSYNIPNENDLEYTMDIVIERVISNDRPIDFDRLELSKEDRFSVFFNMIEVVINNHFDSAFSLPQKKNLIDPTYWKKVCKRVGLPDSSYLNDILRLLQEA